MKKIIIITLVALVILGIIVYYPHLVARKETVYADNFTQKDFEQITVGMSENEVIELIGNPISVTEIDLDTKYFWYSESPNSTHYFKKRVDFVNNVVTNIVDEFYYD